VRIAARLDEFGGAARPRGCGHVQRARYRRADLRAAGTTPLVEQGSIRSLRGIRPGIEAKLQELVETGDIAELAELRRSQPLELMSPGLRERPF